MEYLYGILIYVGAADLSQDRVLNKGNLTKIRGNGEESAEYRKYGCVTLSTQHYLLSPDYEPSEENPVSYNICYEYYQEFILDQKLGNLIDKL